MLARSGVPAGVDEVLSSLLGEVLLVEASSSSPVVEASSDFLLAKDPPTPPPIAAAMTTKTMTASTIQNVFLRIPQTVRSLGG